jgi:hypothetical protein
VRGTSAEAEQRPAQSERLSQLSESLPEWRIRRSGGGAERFVVPFVTIAAEPEDMTRRGWSSFADTRHFIFSKTISEDQRFRHFLAAVCRRRWPSGRRRQAIQRPTDFRKAICRATQTDGGRESFGRGGRNWTFAAIEAHPSDAQENCGFVVFLPMILWDSRSRIRPVQESDSIYSKKT